MKLKHFLPFLLLSIFLLSFNTPHKFYTSITQLEYNTKTQSYEIIMNVFTDDWEKVLSEINQKAIKLDQPGAEKLSEEYLNSMLVMKYKEKKLNYKFIGQELEKDILKIYLELPHKFIPKGLFIKNDCLIAEFDGQINIVNTLLMMERKTYIFKSLNQFQEIK